MSDDAIYNKFATNGDKIYRNHSYYAFERIFIEILHFIHKNKITE